MYILQGNLFSFEELMDLEPKQKYHALFAALDLTPFVKELRKSSPLGRKGRDTESMLRALLAGLCEEIPTFTKLVSRLKSDLRLRYYCGFGIDEEPPSVSTFSRFFQRLTNQRFALEHQAQAIIPLNLRRAKEPPEGITFQGTPICSAGFSMTYWEAIRGQKHSRVERTFSLLKERLGANDLTVRGIKKVVTAQYLSCTAILLSRIAVHFLNKAEKGQAA